MRHATLCPFLRCGAHRLALLQLHALAHLMLMFTAFSLLVWLCLRRRIVSCFVGIARALVGGRHRAIALGQLGDAIPVGGQLCVVLVRS